MKIKQRAAKELLEPAQLLKSRLGRVKNGDIVLIPPYMMKNLYQLRHVEMITRLGNENTIADGELRAKFWKHNIFEPAYYNKLFDRIDEVQEKMPDEMGIVQAIVANG